jgi:fucose 4-O-acetylase-like acetyltransferase
MQEKTDITLAKGLCMLLVVLGHTLAGGVSVGNEWFTSVIEHIYLFHMPFFMFLSGYLYFRPGRVAEIRNKSADHAKKQAVRLLLPFFTLGLIVLVGKFALQSILHVDNVPESFSAGLVKLFWDTDHSPSMFIWYIYVLFFYTVLSPFLYPYFKEKFAYWAAFALVIYFLPYFHHLYIDRIAQYFIFFVAGGWLRQKEETYLAVLDKNIALLGVAVLFAALLAFVPLRPELRSPLGMLIVGLLSIPVLHGLSRRILDKASQPAKLFRIIGDYSYSIYLFNVIVIGVTKGVMFKFTTWDGVHFWYFIPTLIVAGIVAPILAEKLVLQRIPLIRKHILGKPDPKLTSHAS